MATLLSRVSRAIMAEEYPRDRVFWFLEMVALGFVLEAVGALFRGQFAVMITAIVSGGVFGLVAFHWKEIRWVAASVVALASIATSFLWWSNHRPGLVVLYAESPLNGKTVRLIVPTDRTLEIHQMVAWPPEAPTSFSVLGIALRNNADADLQPDIAWISFNAPIQQWRPNTAGWRRSLDVSADGWMSYRHDFPRGK